MTLVNATESLIPGTNYLTHYQKFVRQKSGDGDVLIYKNNRDSRLVIVRVAERIAFQLAEKYWNVLMDWAEYNTTYRLKHLAGEIRAKKALAEQLQDSVSAHEKQVQTEAIRKKILDIQNKNRKELIKRQMPVYDDLGTLVCEGGEKISAVNPYGDVVTDSIIISFEGEDKIEAAKPVMTFGQKAEEKVFKTKTRYFYDINPVVNQSTSKDIILTKVQGRDFTRKELVAGGDISFSVSGSINSNQQGVYPSTQVSRFIEMMQHNGVLDVNHFLFRQFNVKKIIIQDFKLEHPTFKNIQPYSFTCVAVEPDEDVTVVKDTISIINDVFAGSENEGWFKQMLAEKKNNIAIGSEAKVGEAVQLFLDTMI